MRHRHQGRKLGLTSDARRAMLRNQVRELVLHKAIVTTETRAKEVRPMIEKLVTNARQDSVHSRRMAARVLAFEGRRDHSLREKHQYNTETLVGILFSEIAPKFQNRPGGYTRITRLGFRRGDNAPIVKLELLAEEIA
jgi:large subunit ribosomal protein L17